MEETTLLHDIKEYMSTSAYVEHLRKEAPEKANPLFIFAKLHGDKIEVGAASLRDSIHRPALHTVLHRKKSGLRFDESARAYQMGLVHGLRASDIPTIMGPAFDQYGGHRFNASSFEDDIAMIYKEPEGKGEVNE